MDILVLLISIVALIVSLIAYLRSGGKEDIRAAQKAIKQTVDELTLRVQQTSEQMLAGIKAGYDRSIRGITSMQSRLRELEQVAVAELRADIQALEEALEKLGQEAARELESVESMVGRAVVEAEEAMRRAVEEARARLEVIEAQQQLALARFDIKRGNLVDAQSRLATALAHLNNARTSSTRFTENVAAVQNNAQRLLDESRIKAETLETLIEQNNRLLAQMSRGTVTKQAARPATAR